VHLNLIKEVKMIPLGDGINSGSTLMICGCFCEIGSQWDVRVEGFRAGECKCYCGPMGQEEEEFNLGTISP